MIDRATAGCAGAFLSLLAIAIASLGPFEGTAARAEANAVTFPALDSLTHYATVRRGVTREHMLTSEAALGAIQDGQPVPAGTHVVLVDYQSDVLHRYLVAEKLGEAEDSWGYQWFWPDGSIKADENTSRCYSCHQSREDRQFLFTYSDALQWAH